MKCLFCSTEFEPKTKNQKYCNPNCQNKDNQRKFQNKHKSKCQCGKSIGYGFIKCPSCASDSRKDRRVKNDITLYQLKRNIPSPRLFHHYIRSHARRLMKHAKKCVCGYSKHIEICHIKAISKFSRQSKIKEINALDNLVALCPNCHWEFDHGLLKI